MSVSNPYRRAFLQARWKASAMTPEHSYVRVTASCLARNGIACELCRDVCEVAAIQFIPRVPVSIPRLSAERCTSCGACIDMCPVAALEKVGERPS